MASLHASHPPPVRIFVVGLLAGLLVVLFAVTHSALVFSGPLAPFVGTGLVATLCASIIQCAVVGIVSSYRGAVAGPSSESVVLALVLSGAVGTAGLAARPEAAAATAIAIVCLATFLTGIAFCALSSARAGAVVRYLPYPVLGGFVAGIGWLSMLGALSVACALPASEVGAGVLVSPETIQRWLPAAATGLVLIALRGRFGYYRSLPAVLGGAALLFYVVMLARGESVATLEAAGWLLGPNVSGSLMAPVEAMTAIGEADVGVVLQALPGILTYVFVMCVGVMLVGPSLELVTGEEFDIDRELRAAGLANAVSAATGGLAGYQYIGTTSMVHRLETQHRGVPLVAAGVCALALVAGLDLLGLVPRFIAASLLMLIGFDLLARWLIPRHSSPRGDYALVLVVFAAVVMLGIVEGVALGLVASLVFFAVSYARVDIVRHEFSGASLRSRAGRSPVAHDALREHGDEILVLQVEGYLYFGSANRLLDRVRGRVSATQRPALKSVVVDFRSCHGADASAAVSLLRLVRYLRGNEFDLAFACAPSSLMALLEAEGAFQGAPAVTTFDDRDQALEWAENRCLERRQLAVGFDEASLHAYLREHFGDDASVAGLERFAEPFSVPRGDYLLTVGEPADGVYFIESGEASAVVTGADGQLVRLRRMGPGAALGEIGLYLGRPPSASVVAETPLHGLVLSHAALERMQRQAPELSAALHRLLARLLAERLADNTQLVASLMR